MSKGKGKLLVDDEIVFKKRVIYFLKKGFVVYWCSIVGYIYMTLKDYIIDIIGSFIVLNRKIYDLLSFYKRKT